MNNLKKKKLQNKDHTEISESTVCVLASSKISRFQLASAAEQPIVNLTRTYMSCVVRKPAFCICENKDADQLRGNREAIQPLCFRYIDSTIPLLTKYKISSLLPSFVVVQSGLCGTWLETRKTGFLTTRLILQMTHF